MNNLTISPPPIPNGTEVSVEIEGSIYTGTIIRSTPTPSDGTRYEIVITLPKDHPIRQLYPYVNTEIINAYHTEVTPVQINK